MKVLFASALVAALVSTVAQAEVSVSDPWVRATVAQQKATGAFMRITSPVDARLVSASSPVAGVVEIHEMVMDGEIMKMRAIPGLALPAGQSVELKPGGYHVMLIDLKQQVKVGDVVPVSIVVEGADGKREALELKADARPLNTAAPMSQGQGEMKHKH